MSGLMHYLASIHQVPSLLDRIVARIRRAASGPAYDLA